jgi:hypothetical protein
MAKQTFTTGQVLTAAQMTSLQQTAMGGGSATAKTASYVLVAADAGTTVTMNAAGATTITVNTSLFAAGDTVLISNLGAGVTTITAGTATVNTAGSLALVQYESGILYFTATGAAIFNDYVQAAGGASGLTFISRTTFSSVASQAFDGVFTSSYYSYIARIEYIFGGTGADDLQLQFRYAGPSTQTSGYYGSSFETVYNGTSSITGSNNASQGTLATDIGGTPQGTTAEICFNGVGNASEVATYYGHASNIPGSAQQIFNAVSPTARTYTGFLLKSSSSNITGAVSIYGLAKA